MSVHIKKREIIIKNGRNRKARPKTFKTKEAAEAYVKANSITNYTLKNLKTKENKDSKYRIEVSE